MERVQGNHDVALLECTNPVLNKWRVRWDVVADESGNASYMEEELDHKPSLAEIRAIITGWINSQTDARILSGFRYKGKMVWLSMENQFNYTVAHNLAVQTAGATLPVTFKLGDDENPDYVTFETLDALNDFYFAASQFVDDVIAAGWKRKGEIDLEPYRVN